jgi:hypothetical protein
MGGGADGDESVFDLAEGAFASARRRRDIGGF